MFCLNVSGSLKLIGQFCRDAIGCETQVAFVNCDSVVNFDPSVKLGCSVRFVGYVDIVNKSFVRYR